VPCTQSQFLRASPSGNRSCTVQRTSAEQRWGSDSPALFRLQSLSMST